MRMQIFSVYDKKAKDYQGLTLAPNRDVAARWFKEGIPGSGTPMEKYPQDFLLVEVGVFDTATGILMGGDEPTVIGGIADLLETGNFKGLEL